MTFYTPDQIENIAEAIRKHFGYTDEDYFIDITKVATNAGMIVNEVEFEDPNISGMLITNGTQLTVDINRSESEERKRFTIAHEIAHSILHSSKKGNHIDYRQAIKNYTSKDELTKEVQANMLASAILMPKKLVKNAWERLRDIDDIADLFKVSKRAAAIRLESLGLIF